jgi:RNA polymerase sigma factor (sigma-70 family)
VSRDLDRSRCTTAELVSGCSRGDALAWRELVLRHQGLVYGVARSYGLQVADAEEVFQVTFANLARSLGRLRDPERLEAWLATAARRASLRIKTVERRRARIFSSDPADLEQVSHEQVAERVEQLRMAERVRREIDALGPPCSTLLPGLFESPPRPYRELALASGLAIGSLGATRARCLERLRRRLRREIELSTSSATPAPRRTR